MYDIMIWPFCSRMMGRNKYLDCLFFMTILLRIILWLNVFRSASVIIQ